ncbi:MAG: hypothetical protein K2P88_10290 [Chitinophagaceae bacterium]|uniref:hypothetical protein n=1 Tax=unclassified Paraflavitalea TaxID=2798305 RepID=UPI003D33351F|nr:hypothetical protein [Chitinophagaceae bacterium]
MESIYITLGLFSLAVTSWVFLKNPKAMRQSPSTAMILAFGVILYGFYERQSLTLGMCAFGAGMLLALYDTFLKREKAVHKTSITKEPTLN